MNNVIMTAGYKYNTSSLTTNIHNDKHILEQVALKVHNSLSATAPLYHNLLSMLFLIDISLLSMINNT